MTIPGFPGRVGTLKLYTENILISIEITHIKVDSIDKCAGWGSSR